MMTQTYPSSQPSYLAQRMATTPPAHDNNNPLWRGPCAEGPLGGITQSMLVNFLSCRDRFRLKNVVGLYPMDRWNHRPGYGSMWHVCEEALARDEDWATPLDHYVSALEQQYPLQREEINKWHNVCHVQFPEYVRHWTDHPDVRNRDPLLQEQVFDVPYTLPSGRVVRLRGKWDSVDLIDTHTDNDGVQWPKGIWLQENKTKGDIDKAQVERQLTFDLQTMMYLVAMYEAKGIGTPDQVPKWTRNYNHPILGVRYNVIRRPLSGGKGNISPHKAKRTKTKYTPAETDEHFYGRLRDDYIAKEPDYWFFRVRASISHRDIQVFKDTCLDPLLDHLCWWYEEVTGRETPPGLTKYPPTHYRTPFGVWSALEEGGSTEYDHCLATGSEVGLRRVHELFTELK